MKLYEMHEHAFYGQTWSGGDGIEYSIPKLVAWAQQTTKVVAVNVIDLMHSFNDGSDSDEPDDSREFASRSSLSDLKYPLLLGRSGSDLHIIDGRHRLKKAVDSGIDIVRAFVVDIDAIPDNCLA